MSARPLATLAAAAIACACGPSSAGEASDATGDPSGSGDDTSGTDEADDTADDATGTDPGEPACVPRADAASDWQKTGSDDPLPSAGRDVHTAVDGTGRVVVASTDETESDPDVLVAQIDPDGATRWTLRYEGPAGLRDEVLAVAADPDGRVYVAVREETRELVSEGFGTITEFAIVVLAIDADGGKRWRYVREVAPGQYTSNARAADLALTESGDVVLVDVDVSSTDVPPQLLRLDRFGNEILRADVPLDTFDVQDVHIAVTPTDHTWVGITRYGETHVARLDPSGAVTFDIREDADDAYITGVAAGVDEHGHVLVRTGDAEAGTAGLRLTRYATDGAIAWQTDMAFAAGDGHPAGVVLDCDRTPIVAAEISDIPMRTAVLYGFSLAGDPTWVAELDGDDLAPRSLARGPDGALAIAGLRGTTNTFVPWLARSAL